MLPGFCSLLGSIIPFWDHTHSKMFGLVPGKLVSLPLGCCPKSLCVLTGTESRQDNLDTLPNQRPELRLKPFCNITSVFRNPPRLCLIDTLPYGLEHKLVNSIPFSNITLCESSDLESLHCGIQKCKMEENIKVKAKFYFDMKICFIKHQYE